MIIPKAWKHITYQILSGMLVGLLFAVLCGFIGRFFGRYTMNEWGDLIGVFIGVSIGYPFGVTLGCWLMRKYLHQAHSIWLLFAASVFGLVLVFLLTEPLQLNMQPQLLWGFFLLFPPLLATLAHQIRQ